MSTESAESGPPRPPVDPVADPGLDPVAEWNRAGELFAAALELPSDLLAALLNGLEDGLAAEVRSLLAAHRAAGESFLAEPAGGASAALLLGDEGDREGPGDRVGPFRLVRELGRGGMGVVFLAVRVEGGFEQEVAVKLLAAAALSTEAQRRFRRERQILARLDHPGIARLLDGGVLPNGRTWFALERVAGQPIDRFCRERALPVRSRLLLFLAMLDAVEYAHRSLVVHRDLKPGNVLVTAAGEVKLLDFGIAKVLASDALEEGAMALTLQQPLTPHYAAPEQLRGEPVTTATDVYSLGVMLYELLTGRSPYRDPARLVRAVLEQRPPAASLAVDEEGLAAAGLPEPLGELHRRLAGDLDAVLGKALQKEPGERYATVAAFGEELRRHLTGRPVAVRGDALAYRTASFLRRHRAAALAALLMLLSLAGGLAAALVEARRAQREARKAEQVQAFLLRILSASDPAQAKGAAVSVREVLDAGAREISRELAAEPEVADRALEAIASTYLQLGEYDAALPLAERRVELRRRRSAGSGPEVAEAQLLVANLLWDRGRVEEAGAIYAQAWEAFERAGDRRSKAAREAMSGVAAGRRSHGDLAGAEALQRQIVELARRAEGEESPAVSSAENSLAMTLGAAERYAESAAIFRRLAERDRRAGVEDQPDALTHRYNFAVDLVRSGAWGEAGEELRALLPAARRVLGSEHPRLALALRWQAVLLDLRGASQAAQAPLAECLAIQQFAFGPDDVQLAWTRAVAATIAARAGEAPSAESLAALALDRLERELPSGDPALGLAWEGVAQAHLASRRAVEALAAAERALELRSRNPHAGRSLAVALDLAAEAALAAGDGPRARAYGERAVARWESVGSAAHPEAARARLHLAAAYLAQAETERAPPLVAAARAVVEREYLPAAPERRLLARLLADRAPTPLPAAPAR